MLLNSRHSTLECLSNPRKIVHGIVYHILIKLILNKKIQLSNHRSINNQTIFLVEVLYFLILDPKTPIIMKFCRHSRNKCNLPRPF